MYKKLLVPLDGSKLAECVLPHVESIARGCAVEEVVLVRAVEPFRRLSGEDYVFTDAEAKEFSQQHITNAREYLDTVAGRISLEGIRVEKQLIKGRPAESIAEYASGSDIDLITIATHGRSGISRWAWGSVADRVLRSSCVPVLMIRAPGCVPGI